MKEATIILTESDKLVLESYKNLVDGLSDYLGRGYELVLHSLEDFDHSVIKIINGYHTGREEGAPITDLALNMLRKIRECDGLNNISYFTKNKQGEQLKSSTIAIRGENNRVIGLLCMNFYLNTSFYEMVSTFAPQLNEKNATQETESFVNSTDELIRSSVLQVRDEVMDNPLIQANNKNREIIAKLNERGIFRLKDGVIKAADILRISKNTVYMHIRNISE